MIFTMVVIGGITRLTDSGLSMSTWKLIGGAPPLNPVEWDSAFDIYKKTPEGKVNPQYNLDDFKVSETHSNPNHIMYLEY